MIVESAIADQVASLSSVVALVGSRVYVDKLPQSPTYPCVRVLLIDDPGGHYLRGPDGLGRARIQIDAFARESSSDAYAAASAVADAIEGDAAGDSATGLSGWIGDTPGSPSLRVVGCFFDSRRRQYDPEELNVVTISQDFIVRYVRQ